MSSDNVRFRNMLLSNTQEAIAFLYDKYYKSLFRYAYLITKDKESSEDIVQEAILYIWMHREQFASHQKPIRHYLVKIVRSRSLSYFRKAAHIDVDDIPESSHPLNYETVELAKVEEEALQQLRNVIATFPNREQQCLMMTLDDGLSPDEIALHFKISRKAVERALTSGLKRLRSWAHHIGFP